jgi:quinol monooxygenase YgiN
MESFMIVEYIRYAIPAEASEAFEAAYASAQEHLAAAPECLGYELSRCTEDPTQYVVRINWVSLDGHLQGFRKGERFPPFLGCIRPYIPQILEMRHYAVVAGDSALGLRHAAAT